MESAPPCKKPHGRAMTPLPMQILARLTVAAATVPLGRSLVSKGSSDGMVVARVRSARAAPALGWGDNVFPWFSKGASKHNIT